MWVDAPELITQVSDLGADVEKAVPLLEDEVWCDGWEVEIASLECIH